MALSKIDVANMLTGATPVANGGTALTSGFVNGKDPRPDAKPIIYNGDMAVAQRGTSFTGVSSGSNFPVDRFEFYPTNLGAYTIIQEALTSGEAYNNGFRTALRIDTTTADASPASTDYAILRTKFEGKDLGLFKKGTSNAEKFTLAFWVKSNKTTTGQVNLFDIDNNRLVSGTYATSSANTWEKKVINFPADTTGGFDNDNALSLIVEFFLDSGSNFSSGTAPTAWEAQTNADRNANNFAIGSSTDNDFALTGVQLEVGEFSSTTIPPFQFENFGDNLQRCQRYFNILMNSSAERTDSINAHIHDNDTMRGSIHFPVEMRSTPSITSSSSGSADHWRYISNGINTNYGSAITMSASSKSAQFTLVDTGGTNVSGNVNEPGQLFNNTTSCFLKIDAEL
tara:strand:+ start:783 stop:1976 length:1194 start_codon:yes stop_codon:yes gene_type:complete